MIKVDQFCFRFDLKTGAIIIGVVHLIFGILYLSVGFAGVSGNIGGVVIWNGAGFFGILDILAAISLLYGTMKKNPSFLIPYLVIIPLELAVDWIILVLTASLLYALTTMVILTLIYGYFWICVFSFWNMLK